jgi:hypothetical protein
LLLPQWIVIDGKGQIGGQGERRRRTGEHLGRERLFGEHRLRLGGEHFFLLCGIYY